MKKRTSIGIDIGKRRCDVCIVDGTGKVLETDQYPNTTKDARRFAEKIARRYKGDSCTAACETTGNMWARTYEAFEAAGIPIKLANTYKMAVISKTGKKTDKVDAEKMVSPQDGYDTRVLRTICRRARHTRHSTTAHQAGPGPYPGGEPSAQHAGQVRHHNRCFPDVL